MSSIYAEWGLTQNPFASAPLPATKLGETLLVGRSPELSSLKMGLYNPPGMTTVEGQNGIGKTSVVNVAAYQAYRSFVAGSSAQLLIPCAVSFQLDGDKDADDIIDEVFLAVAQTLLDESEALKTVAKLPERKQLDVWLNSPLLGGLSLGPFGGAAEANSGKGFERSGFRALITNLLKEIFPTAEAGGVVCVLDNLELLQTSKNARDQLGVLRDPLLTLHGLRWVLCGALGIIRSAASSPRLEGWLHEPLEIDGMQSEYAPEVLRARLEAYADGEGEAPYLPIDETGFEFLYEVLAGNLRNTLKYSDNYCFWVAKNKLHPEGDSKAATLETWFSELSAKYLAVANKELGGRAWEVFDGAAHMGGSFAPSDYEALGANSSQALRPHVKALEDLDLLQSQVDETDSRRRTISLTPKGWFTRHAREVEKSRQQDFELEPKK